MPQMIWQKHTHTHMKTQVCLDDPNIGASIQITQQKDMVTILGQKGHSNVAFLSAQSVEVSIQT
jgi:hypothetical protein